MYTKKTKIVSTLGPASEAPEMIEKLAKTGVNVFRLNFSHGDHAEHGARIKRIKEARKKLGTPVGILQDLAGPKVRIGDFKDGQVELKKGQTFIITSEKIVGDEKRVSVNHAKLPQEVKKGDTIFLEDGKKKLVVEKTTATEVYTKVIVGGVIKSRRGVNTPGVTLSIKSFTDKDKKDLAFGVSEGVDFAALSFVQTAADIKDLRQALKKHKAEDVKIVAKIETQSAVDHIKEIIAETDAIMVARGDLALEVPAEKVPVIQKQIILECNRQGKPVITATQMLGSMTSSPTPSRAEVNDVANAIFDGTDAIMLSEETAAGNFPVEAVETMVKIAKEVEKSINHEDILAEEHLQSKSVTDAISHSALGVAHDVDAVAIVALSQSGYTGRMISRHRPHRPLVVITPSEKVANQLALSFGTYPIIAEHFDSLSEVVSESEELIKKIKLAKKGDKIIIVAGLPLQKAGSTNLVFVEEI